MANGGKKAKKKLKKKSKKGKSPLPPPTGDHIGAISAATQYLEQWALQQKQPKADPIVWKFNKTRQTFLLRVWPQREKLSSDAFKTWLLYAQTLPAACAERTVTQAREVVAAAEAAEQALLEQQSQHEQRAAAKAAAAAEADEEDEDDATDAPDDDGTTALSPEDREEKRAILKIRRARALRLLQVLVEPAA